ncbi:MAG: MarC family protein [Chlamydiales bacterium]|nr:MarC family protein [Chlamydiales bacterium]
MTTAQIAATLFLIMDPFGNVPAFIALLKNFDAKKQRRIIFRELLIALGIILLFNFLGDEILSMIGVTQATVQLAGGIILFLISLQMIFPKSHHAIAQPGEEPFIVPLAVPLIAGPSIIGTVMIYAHQEGDFFKTTLAILIAWSASTLILLASSWMQRIFGARVLIAGERLMGLMMTILAVNMFTDGIRTLVT